MSKHNDHPIWEQTALTNQDHLAEADLETAIIPEIVDVEVEPGMPVAVVGTGTEIATIEPDVWRNEKIIGFEGWYEIMIVKLPFRRVVDLPDWVGTGLSLAFGSRRRKGNPELAEKIVEMAIAEEII